VTGHGGTLLGNSPLERADTGRMGKGMTKLTLENMFDAENAANGLLEAAKVRRLELEGLVDTGATTLVIPADAAVALGLREIRRKKARVADGRAVEFAVVTGLRLAIFGREMTCDALVAPVGMPVLIGQIPLEALDLIVDPKSQEARPNAAHPDGPVYEILRAC